MDSLAQEPTAQPKTQASSSTAFELLAAELLVDIVSLAQPRPSTVVSTSSAIGGCGSAGDSNRHRIGRHWRQHLIFHAPLARQVTHELDEVSPMGLWYPQSKQIDARITYFFKSRLPAPGESSEPASCIAPTCPAEDGIFTSQYVDWLFDASGPFVRTIQPPIAGENVFGQEWLLRWNFLPDAFQLVIFFLRGGRIDLLKHSLAHLARILPELASDLQPASYWYQFGLDNRVNLRAMVASVIVAHDLPMSFPTFLYVLALIDWLPPALDALEAIFPSTSAQFISGMSVWSFPVDCMLSTTMCLCECPTRITSMLDWLLEGGYAFDHDAHFTFSPYAGCFTVFKAVFLKYDLPRLASIDKSVVQTEIGHQMAMWALAGERDLLPLAFEKGMIGGDYMCEFILGELLLTAIRESDEWLQGKIACCAETPEQLQAIVNQALTSVSNIRALPDSRELEKLFSPLVQPAVDLTAFILEHASEWDQSIIETILVNTQLADHLDLVRILNHWLDMLAANQSLPAAIGATFIQLLQRTVDSTNLRVTALGATPALCAFTACLHQVALTDQFALSPRFRPLFASLGAAARSDGTSMDSLPLLLRGQLREVVVAASIRWDTIHDSDSPTCTTPAATDAAALDARFAFDQVYALDRAFAKACVSWSPSPPCPYIWALFDANELVGKVKQDVAIRALHQAVDRDCDQADFVAILERIPAQIRRNVLLRVLVNVRGKSKALLAAVEKVGEEGWRGLAVEEDVEPVDEEDGDVFIDRLL